MAEATDSVMGVQAGAVADNVTPVISTEAAKPGAAETKLAAILASPQEHGANPPVEAAKEQAPVEEAPKPVELSERAKQAVKSLGWADEKVRELGDRAPAILEDFAKSMDRSMGKVGGKMADLLKKNAELEEQLKAKPSKPVAADATPADDAGDEVVTADEMEFEPTKAVQKILAALERERTERVAELKSIRDSMGAVKAPKSGGFDSFYDSLDEDGRAVFGTGPTEKLAADSPERAARTRLERIAEEFVKVKETVGEPMTLEEAMRCMSLADEAVAAQSQKREQVERLRKIKARAAQTERRPDSGRSGVSEASPYEKHKAKLTEILSGARS